MVLNTELNSTYKVLSYVHLDFFFPLGLNCMMYNSTLQYGIYIRFVVHEIIRNTSFKRFIIFQDITTGSRSLKTLGISLISDCFHLVGITVLPRESWKSVLSFIADYSAHHLADWLARHKVPWPSGLWCTSGIVHNPVIKYFSSHLPRVANLTSLHSSLKFSNVSNNELILSPYVLMTSWSGKYKVG